MLKRKCSNESVEVNSVEVYSGACVYDYYSQTKKTSIISRSESGEVSVLM